MRNFVIFLEGENFNLKVDGKIQSVGFFASRRVEAETENEASNIAIELILKEKELEFNALQDYKVSVKVVHDMPIDHKNTYSGFTFFPMEE
jgi:hypothetical protein